MKHCFYSRPLLPPWICIWCLKYLVFYILNLLLKIQKEMQIQIVFHKNKNKSQKGSISSGIDH